jgi:prepilin-type N-terminal cleavage/methylation domain-containing protein
MQKVFYLTSYLGVIMSNIKNEQSGFTLVELVIAVALVGVLSIVAIPKITGVSDDARQASVNGVAFSLAESSKRNYMIRGADNSKGFEVTKCDDPVEGLEGNTLPAGFALVAGSSAAAVELAIIGTTLTECEIETTTTPKKTATYKTYGIA